MSNFTYAETHGGISMTTHDADALRAALRDAAGDSWHVTEEQIWDATAGYYLGDCWHYRAGVRALAESMGLIVFD